MTEVTSKEIAGLEVRLKPHKWVKGLMFVMAMWLLSRLVIIVVMELIAPLTSPLPLNYYTNPIPFGYVPGSVPTRGWELFTHWDGAWYLKIATLGYDYAKNVRLNELHSTAFFPLFPLLIRGVMTLGIPVDVAGFLVNNVAFFGALLIVYRWVEERHNTTTARWATAVLAWCPYSLYGTVVYSEGLFVLLTAAALRAFEKHQYTWAAVWGALATATRLNGSMIIPTFLILAWREHRPVRAYAVGILAGVGLLSFIIYCAIAFGDPLAFIHVQQGWRSTVGGFDWHSWLKILVTGLTFEKEFIKFIMIFGGGFLLWHFRNRLSSVLITYGFCSLGLLIASGSTMSVDRVAYGIVSLPIALGVLLAEHPRWGYAIIGYFAILLPNFALRFARWLWVA
jgi:Gpi18-like mannosyltransferase